MTIFVVYYDTPRYNRKTMKRSFQTVLTLSLCLSLSGAVPALFSAKADGMEQLQIARSQAQTQTEAISVLIRRARHPGTPGTPSGVPSPSDVRSAERAILAIRDSLQRTLSLPNAPTSGSTSSYIPVDAKLPLLNVYFNLVASITTLRIALHLPHGADWRGQFSLRLPKAILDEFPGLGASAQSRLGERYLPLIVDRGAQGNADPVELKVSESLVHGLEIGALVDRPNDANHLTLIQYLAIRQLFQNIAESSALRGQAAPQFPTIPEPLASRIASLNLSGTIFEEQRRAVAEPGARGTLLQTYTQIAAELPSFVSDAYLQDILALVTRTAAERRAASSPLRTVLTEAERDLIGPALEQELAASSLPLSTLPEAELKRSLRYFLASAKAATQINKLLGLMADGVINPSESERARILDRIEAAKARYLQSLSESPIERWKNLARAADGTRSASQRRREFIEKLIVASNSISESTRELFAGDRIDMPTLMRSLSADILALQPRDSVRGWVQEIAASGSYSSARDTYTRRLSDLADSSIVIEGLIDPGLAEAFVNRHDFRPEIRFTSRVTPRLQDELIRQIVDGRKKDIRDLISIGSRLGFHFPRLRQEPSLREIVTERSKRESYYTSLRDQVLSDYPVLAQEVDMIASSSGRTEKIRLSDALSSISRSLTMSEALLARAEPYVLAALAQAERQCRSMVASVARATDLQQIERTVTSSMMLELVLSGFPEFRVQQDHFVETLLRPSFTGQLVHRYIGTPMMYGFGALMLLHFGPKLIKRFAPWSEVLQMGLSPWIQGFTQASLYMIVADTAYQAAELRHAYLQNEATENLFATGTTGRGFVDHGELTSSQGAYSFSKWMFIGRLGMDVAFMYIPMGRQLYSRIASRMLLKEFARDVNSFQTLGLEPGRWGDLEAAIGRVRASESLNAEAKAMAESAFRRLQAKVNSGDAWDLEAILNDKTVTRAEARLRDALRSAHSGGGH